MNKILIVVDMQNDFVTGALRNEEGIKIVPAVVKRLEKAVSDGEKIIFTRDTHFDNYMETEEGRNLPVPHCIKGTEGWEIIPELKRFTDGADIYDKPVFGSLKLGEDLAEETDENTVIELIGLCTDICVISNAVIARAARPDAHIIVDASCCAGVTPESHKTALNAMKTFQVEIVNED
ncbi:MAG: cysteine hydrolase [Lachnospiraceae bacterium]|nr:cysteine hydrolase [Lachnospiraceae bacterium]